MPAGREINRVASPTETLTSPQMTQHHRWRCIFIARLPAQNCAKRVDLGEVLAKLVFDYTQ
jgi:hypothetical protein